MRASETPAIRSLVYATDVDVLAADKAVIRRDGYWRIASPSDPTFWWGNFLLFDDAPVQGDRSRWEALFEREFSDYPGIAHKVFAWDRPDGARGAAEQEFPPPYAVEESVGLIAPAGGVKPHPRANAAAEVVALDPTPGADSELWEAVFEVQMAGILEEDYARELDDRYLYDYRRQRNENVRRLLCAGGGGWYVALLDGEVAGSLGIIVTAGRARYQQVDTARRFRGRGIASRLVAEAARLAAQEQQIDNYVIVADPDYHAIGIYESLGFVRAERVCGVQLRPVA